MSTEAAMIAAGPSRAPARAVVVLSYGTGRTTTRARSYDAYSSGGATKEVRGKKRSSLILIAGVRAHDLLGNDAHPDPLVFALNLSLQRIAVRPIFFSHRI